MKKLRFIKCHQAVSTPGGAKLSFTVGLEGCQSLELEDNLVVVTVANRKFGVPLANIPWLEFETQEEPKAPKKK